MYKMQILLLFLVRRHLFAPFFVSCYIFNVHMRFFFFNTFFRLKDLEIFLRAGKVFLHSPKQIL